MSEFPSAAGSASGGSWCGSHVAGPPTPAPSPSSHNSGMRQIQPQGIPQPYQCGICYDYLSSNVDDLDEHIMKHKRELAERLDAQKESANDAQEAAFHSQTHQTMHFFASPTHNASSPGQTYEYQTQPCGTAQQVPQFRDFRTHTLEYRAPEEYYGHHQGASSGLVNLYTNESLNRSAASSVTAAIQQDDYNQESIKRTRYDTHTFEREALHTVRADLSEENTADADPSADALQNELEHGPVSFTDPQTSDAVSYHEMQPLKSSSSSNISTSLNNDRSSCDSAAASFGAEQEGSSLVAQEPDSADASRTHTASLLPDSPTGFSLSANDGAKHSNDQPSKDAIGNDFDAELHSTAEDTAKALELPSEDHTARVDNDPAAPKGPKDNSSKEFVAGAAHDERAPRTRRSTRMQHGRK